MRHNSLPGGRAQGERLAAKRKRRRRRVRIVCCMLGIILCIGVLYGLQKPGVRISHIEVVGADPSLIAMAQEVMQGSYGWIVPRDSIFFFPESSIRARIINQREDIAAISISRKGFTGLTMKADTRVPVAPWCGLAPTEGVEEYCYLFDPNGFIYTTSATSTQTLNNFKLYAPLEGDSQEPLRATIAGADRLPGVFHFARELTSLGSPVGAVIVRGNEVHAVLASGTRIVYVLGHEQEAFTALVSAKNNLNLTDGSLDYVDLRFGAKMYIKKRGNDTVAE